MRNPDAWPGAEGHRELASPCASTEGGALAFANGVEGPVVETLFGYGAWWNSGSTYRESSRALRGTWRVWARIRGLALRWASDEPPGWIEVSTSDSRGREHFTVASIQAGWYDDGAGRKRWWDGQTWTDQYESPLSSEGGVAGIVNGIEADAVSGAQPRPTPSGASCVVLQVILKEKMWGTGSGNFTELEHAVNAQAALGYRLHAITTASSGRKGIGGGDRIQATMVFERLT